MINIILDIAMLIMGIAFLITVIRFILGPSVIDRIISFDLMTIISLGVMANIAHFSGRMIYLDVTLIYGLLGFLSVIIISKYLEKGL